MKQKIIFLGSRPLGKKALAWLSENPLFEILGAVLYPKNKDRYWKEDPRDLINCINVPELTLKDLSKLDFDIALSVNYHKIIDASTLKLAPLGFWNVHHSHNLRLKGRNITTQCILLARKENCFHHGTCLHLMGESLDDGLVIDSKALDIENDDTAHSLFLKCDIAALAIIKEWLPRIATQAVHPYQPQKENTHFFRAADIPSRCIDPTWPPDRTFDFVRAFEFPPFEPAYIENEKKRKVHLVTHSFEPYVHPINYLGYQYFTTLPVG